MNERCALPADILTMVTYHTYTQCAQTAQCCAVSGANCVSAAGWEHCTRDTNGISRQELRPVWC